MHPKERQVAEFIRNHHLLKGDGHYLVALSGGADSVSLLLILRKLSYNIEAIHCNFNLRGEESKRDEEFCEQLCTQLNVVLHHVHFDTRTYARQHGVSVEMAARHLRYHHFAQLCHDIQADGICVAHHQDDSVETVLMNLIRGTGILGLTGISPYSEYTEADFPLPVIRPLLCMTREDIETYLKDNGQEYVVDSSNLRNDVMRNRIRLDVMPVLRQVRPSAAQGVANTALRMNEAFKVFEKAIRDSRIACSEQRKSQLVVNIGLLLEQPSSEYTLYYILRDYAFSSAQIEQIYQWLMTGEKQSGRIFRSSTHQLLINRGEIIIEPKIAMQKAIRIPESGVYVINDGMRLRVNRMEGHDVSKEKNFATLDADDIVFPLVVRSVEEGDSFQPFGMKGFKLVSDYMTDRKMSLFDKQRQLVLVDADGRILWLVGERTDNRFAVDASTRRVLRIEVI